MLNRKVIIALVCISPVMGMAQQRKELASLSYNYIPVKRGDTTSSATVMDIELGLPVFKRSKESLVLKFEVGKMTFKKFPEETHGTLYSLALQGAYSRKFSDNKKTLTLFGKMGIYSDMEDVSGEDMRGTIGFQYKYTRSETLKYGLGLAYSNQFFGHQVSPYVSFDYSPSARWNFYGQIPTNIRAVYLISEKDNIGLGIHGVTHSYRLTSKLTPHPYDNSGFIQTTQWSAKLYYEHVFGDHFSLIGSTGFAVVNKFRQYNYIPGSMLNSWTIITVPVGKKRPDPAQEISKAGIVYQVILSYHL